MSHDKPQSIGDLLKLPRRETRGDTSKSQAPKAAVKRTGANSERADLIGKFTDRLNETRDGKKYKKLTYARIAALLSHLSKQDLYYLWSYCDKARNFSSTFWWSINPKKHEQGANKEN